MYLSIWKKRFIRFLLAVVLGLLLYAFDPLRVGNDSACLLAVALSMIVLWVTEALSMPVVALVPLFLFPLLKIQPIEDVSKAYANPVIFLFLGGFLLGLAIEKWDLHRRIALGIIRMTGSSGDRIILGFILSTAFISLWLSNTATTMMMFPIALSVIQVLKQKKEVDGNLQNFSITLMLAIAYASNLGGIGTIIGTPPNVAYVAYIEKEVPGLQIGFLNWMLLALPLGVMLVLALYVVMVKWLYPNRIRSSELMDAVIESEWKALGKMSGSQKRVLWIFGFTVMLWMGRVLINKLQPWIVLDDTLIALLGGFGLFLCPVHPSDQNEDRATDAHLLEWSDTEKLAWGILLLFGGGLALAGALEKAGLIGQLGLWLSNYASAGFWLVLLITTLSLLISEVMSNVAQVIVFAPVVTALATALHINPLLLGVPMTLAASCAGMLPMGTPPNAIVFASGQLRLRHMLVVGGVMNLIAIVLITLFCWFLLPMIF
ncbi:MAG: DASS family sodium-coupled anion symporter [Bacteroidetes bacterium]|nr:DASS family sodium-coupled anion symporter [Bacteroidota bacterium]